jgi:glutamate racemase
VARYAVQAAQALACRHVKGLVIACNTAAAVGIDAVRTRMDQLPVIGVIEPGAEAACAATRSGRIAVIATEATVRGGAYERAILRRLPDAEVTQRAAQLLVALAEEGLAEGPVAEGVARHYLGALFEAGAAQSSGVAQLPDTLVLGCTHFPLLAGVIRAVVGEAVRIVDSAQTTAVAVRERLTADALARTGGAPSLQFLATDSPERFARVGSQFLGGSIAPEQIELIDL